MQTSCFNDRVDSYFSQIFYYEKIMPCVCYLKANTNNIHFCCTFYFAFLYCSIFDKFVSILVYPQIKIYSSDDLFFVFVGWSYFNCSFWHGSLWFWYCSTTSFNSFVCFRKNDTKTLSSSPTNNLSVSNFSYYINWTA